MTNRRTIFFSPPRGTGRGWASQVRAIARSASLERTATALALCAITCFTISCSSSDTRRASPTETSGTRAPASAPAPSLADIPTEPESVEPWTFNNKPGQVMTTEHYRVYTTESRNTLIGRLPLFMETALAHYRVAITGDGATLPPPPLKLDTFILGSRSDWELLARQLLADQADPFLKIKRGGFAIGGRALLFDLGTYDTLAVTAHEGWHQYTQRTFQAQLPIWLEEGLATYMEGHRWAGRGSRPTFMPWANAERFDQLRRAQARNQLLSLEDLLNAAPQNLISTGNSEPGLNYYAQVWALTHFLNEGANGRYAEHLRSAVQDAASGRFASVVQRLLGSRSVHGMALRLGPAAFTAYFNPNLSEASAEYRQFINDVVATGSREAISRGVSPIAAKQQPGAQPAASDPPAREPRM